MDREKYYFWLSSLKLFDREVLKRMLMQCGDIEELFGMRAADLAILGEEITFDKMDEWDRENHEETVEKKWEETEKAGLRYYSCEHPLYPEKFREIDDYPIGIFVKGRLPDPKMPTVSIVGARRGTDYGLESAYFFGRELALSGVTVVSGMALGVDGAAQKGALSAEGESFAVLAGGADICYPMENIGLYKDLSEKGGILSERPAGFRGLPRDFPVRNRLVSALSDCVIVIEAAEHSGSLITVQHALMQNREVFALPGRVTDVASRGCNELLKNGAQVLTCPEDVLQYLGISVRGESYRKPRAILTAEENTVYGCIGYTVTGMDELLEKTAMPVGVLSELLIRLEIKGIIRKENMGGYVRR